MRFTEAANRTHFDDALCVYGSTRGVVRVLSRVQTCGGYALKLKFVNFPSYDDRCGQGVLLRLVLADANNDQIEANSLRR